MATGDTIPIAHVEEFSDNFRMRVQQKGSKFRGFAEVSSGVTGESKKFDRIGTTEMQQKTTRYGDTPQNDAPFSDRIAYLSDWENNLPFKDASDVIRLGNDPESKLVMAGTNAAGRKMDDLIIAAAEGSASTRDANGAVTTVALPSASIVLSGTTALTLAKVQSTREKFDGYDVDPDRRKVLYVGPQQITNLLDEPKLTSADYNKLNSMENGDMVKALGFHIIMTNRLTKTGNDRQCIAMVEGAMGLAIGADIKSRISERPDKSYSWQVYTFLSMGAVRIEDELVVRVDATES